MTSAALLLPLLAWLGYLSCATAADTGRPAIPPVPTYKEIPLLFDQPVTMGANGELAWLGARPIVPVPAQLPPNCWAWELVGRRWNPATGAFAETPLPLGGQVTGQIALPAGILALSTIGCQSAGKGDRLRLGLLTPQGKHITTEVDAKIGEMPQQLLALSNDSAVIVTRTKTARHIAAYLVRLDRKGETLMLERMPDLPMPYRGDFAAVVLVGGGGEGRLMILGGSDGQYRGCSPCRANTKILDLKTRIWSDGPDMLEARSELSATRLSDGSVLVTGGWTSNAGWGHGPSRSAERWNPVTNKFEAVAPMPTGTSRHRGIWLPGQEGRTLLITEGTSGTAQAFDVASKTWRTAGEWIQGSEEGGCGFMPFAIDGNAYAWLLNRTEGHYSTKSCGEQQYAALSLLRPPSGAPLSRVPPPESLLITYRSGAAFVPATGDKPALSIGGSTHAGMNSYLMTSTVEIIGRDGRMATLPSLREARANAIAFRFGDGVLVAGGRGIPRNADDRDAETRTLPMEWLASTAPGNKGANENEWVEIAGPGLSRSSAVGQLADGSLLEVDEHGGLSQLRLTLRAGVPTIERIAWPGLSRERRSTDNELVRVRELADGRIMVAGGQVRAEKIALLKADSDHPDAIDEYVGIGDFLPSRRHEIYDPVAKRWLTSAAAVAAGGNVTILDDGRVLKLGSTQVQGAAESKPLLEISSANGMAWTTMPPGTGSRMRLSDKYRAFSVDGELFASGELDGINTGGGPSGVEWFNTSSKQWELLWQAGEKDNWRSHVGRILVRRLGLAKGAEEKIVVLPVEGL